MAQDKANRTFLFTRNRYAVSILVADVIFSLYSMWGRLWRDGYFESVQQLWRVRPHVLPGSNIPILTTYLGIGPLDQLLTFSIILFANVTDGSAPQFSLFAFHFTGQWSAMLMIIIMEGMRRGNRKSIMSLPIVWLMFMQGMTYACGMPVYCLVHLLTSSTASQYDETGPEETEIDALSSLEALPIAITAGYWIPTILMSLRLENHFLHQWLGGAWQGHPMWILLVQLLIENSTSPARRVSAQLIADAQNVSGHPSADSRWAVQVCYIFAATTAAITHISSLAIVATRTLFPSLFSIQAQDALTFSKVYQPPSVYVSTPSKSMIAAVHAFFQYDLYVGSLTTIFWALCLYLRARRSALNLRHGLALFSRSVGICLMGGPAAVVLFVLWTRDREAMQPRNRQHPKKA